MKRHQIAIEAVADRANLQAATLAAARGKRHRSDCRAWLAGLEGNLQTLATGLLAGTVPVGQARHFTIHDPKQRQITAPVFPERVLHHALMRPIAPLIERRLRDHTFACRLGGGQFAALDHAQRALRRWPCWLQLDVRRYFDSIPHDQVLAPLRRLIAGPAVLALLERIISAYAVSPGRGLPIGALTSQHLANLYLERIDRMATETLHCRAWLRYMDDLVLWGRNMEEIRSWLPVLESAIAELGLTFKPPRLGWSVQGLRLLGWWVQPQGRLLDRRGRRRLRRRLQAVDDDLLTGRCSAIDAQRRAEAACAWARQGDTLALRRAIVAGLRADA